MAPVTAREELGVTMRSTGAQITALPLSPGSGHLHPGVRLTIDAGDQAPAAALG